MEKDHLGKREVNRVELRKTNKVEKEVREINKVAKEVRETNKVEKQVRETNKVEKEATMHQELLKLRDLRHQTLKVRMYKEENQHKLHIKLMLKRSTTIREQPKNLKNFIYSISHHILHIFLSTCTLKT
jgi:hypothetical protein